MDIAVLDYGTGRVAVYQRVEVEEDSESIEEFLVAQGHNLDGCHWMSGKDIQVDWE